MSRNTTRRRRHVTTDLLTGAYARLRKEGVPQFVTSHEAYRMTDGRVGTKSDHNLQHGFGLMALVKKAGGDLHAAKIAQDVCDHDEVLPVPGLATIEACMDCGLTRTVDAVPPLAEQGKILREGLRSTPRRGDVVSYTKPFLAKGEAPRWRVRYVDPSDGTLTLDLLGHSKRSTARFDVHPGKVTIRTRMDEA